MVERAVYSLWTKPMDYGFVGFNSEKSFIEAFALSLHYTKKWFKEVHFITDKKGKELVDKWGLTFDYVSTDLEEVFEGKDARSCWALGKIYACKIQEKPFIHLDTDVFLFKKLPEKFLSSDAGFQHTESQISCKYYISLQDHILNVYPKTPKWILKNKLIQAYNCGVILFNKLDILNEWWEEALQYTNYLNQNKHNLLDTPPLMYEQVFVHNLCKYNKYKVDQLSNYGTPEQSTYPHLIDEIAEKLGYTHIIGPCKRRTDVEERIRLRLVKENVLFDVS